MFPRGTKNIADCEEILTLDSIQNNRQNWISCQRLLDNGSLILKRMVLEGKLHKANTPGQVYFNIFFIKWLFSAEANEI